MRPANVKNATSELEGSKVDPGEESMNSVANERSPRSKLMR